MMGVDGVGRINRKESGHHEEGGVSLFRKKPHSDSKRNVDEPSAKPLQPSASGQMTFEEKILFIETTVAPSNDLSKRHLFFNQQKCVLYFINTITNSKTIEEFIIKPLLTMKERRYLTNGISERT